MLGTGCISKCRVVLTFVTSCHITCRQDDDRKDSYRDGPDGGDRRRYGGRDDRYGDRRDYGGRDDRYGDRRDDRYGDRRGGYGGRGRYGGRGSPEYRREEPSMERPRIKLQPRSKPVEETSSEYHDIVLTNS